MAFSLWAVGWSSLLLFVAFYITDKEYGSSWGLIFSSVHGWLTMAFDVIVLAIWIMFCLNGVIRLIKMARERSSVNRKGG